jgi:hypothetical protein
MTHSVTLPLIATAILAVLLVGLIAVLIAMVIRLKYENKSLEKSNKSIKEARNSESNHYLETLKRANALIDWQKLCIERLVRKRDASGRFISNK